MKTLRDNWFVKTTYAYLDLFQKVIPLIFFLFIFQIVFIILQFDKIYLDNLDFWGLLSSNQEVYLTKDIILAVFIGLSNIFIFSGIYLLIIKLTRFLKNVFENNPFIEENGRHLKFAGVLSIIITCIYHIIKVLSIPDLSPSVSFTISLLAKLSMLIAFVFNPYLIIGLFILVIGELIIQAAKLKQESDLTV